MARSKRRRPDARGLRQWAAATRACLEMMRAGVRIRHPAASEAEVTRRVRARVIEQSMRDLDCWRRNG